MMNVKNRLRILGTNEDVAEIKAFFDSSKGDEKQVLDLTKVASKTREKIDHVEVGYDTYTFESEHEILDIVKDLSKRFENVKFSYKTIINREDEKDNVYHVETAKNHYILLAGEIIGESTSRSERNELRVKNNSDQIEAPKTDKPDKNELVAKDELYDLQDRFFKDVQEFMKDFTNSFFDRWF